MKFARNGIGIPFGYADNHAVENIHEKRPLMFGFCKAAILPIFLIAATSGCTHEQGALVKGTVTYEGKRLGGGTVLFNPMDDDLPATHAPIQTDGTYQLRATPGKHKVVVNFYTKVDPEVEVGDPGYQVPRPLIPPKYSSLQTTPLRATVEPGETTVDLTL